MVEENAGAVAGSGQVPAMTRITLNGEEVEVPDVPDVIGKLKAAEHNLLSGFNKKLETERNQLKEEKERTQKWLQEDIDFLSTHDPEDYQFYASKVVHGEAGGFKPPENRTTTTTTRSRTMENTNPMESTAEIKALKEKLEKLEQQFTSQQTMTDEQAKQAAINAKDAALGQYKFADKEAVIARMESHFFKTGQHPSPQQVMDWAKTDHERVVKHIPASQTTTTTAASTTATPPAGGRTPDTTGGGEKKRIPLWDFDAQVDDYREYRKNATPGG